MTKETACVSKAQLYCTQLDLNHDVDNKLKAHCICVNLIGFLTWSPMFDGEVIVLLLILFLNCIFQPLVYSFLRAIKTRVGGEVRGFDSTENKMVFFYKDFECDQACCLMKL